MSQDEGEQRFAIEVAQDAIADLVQKLDPGSMVTRYIVLIEVVDSDSDRGVWHFTAPGASAWDTLGLLEYGKSQEYAAQACGHE